MGKFISNFDTAADFAAFSATTAYSEPHVTLIKENNEVRFIEPKPIIDGHEYVDLDLPSGTLWATMNVGASSPTDYGNYYQYGKGADDISITSGDSIYEGTEDPLAVSADTAAQVWGGQWHTPTKTQCQELTANTTFTWETNFNNSGINGGKFTAQNGKYVFFPAGGRWNYTFQSMTDVGSYSYNWTSQPFGNSNANVLYSNSSIKSVDLASRKYGHSVRGVVG